MSKKQNPIYWTWSNMKRRCNSYNHKDAYSYIGRGIGYDSKWETFEGFCEDMYPAFKPGLTLDRIDNDKGYSAKNCRWATPKEQSNNTRRNRLFTINGKTKTLAQWCDESTVKPSAVRQRYYVLGWTIEKALSIQN
jgi:hypothetical protein